MKAKVLNNARERAIALIWDAKGYECIPSPDYLRRVCDTPSGIALIRVDA